MSDAVDRAVERTFGNRQQQQRQNDPSPVDRAAEHALGQGHQLEDEQGRRYIDGDTIERPDGSTARVVPGDAPEIRDRTSAGHPGATAATQWLRENYPQADSVEDAGEGHFGRDLVRPQRDGEDLMTQGVRAGAVFPDPDSSEQRQAADQAFIARRMGDETKYEQARREEAESRERLTPDVSESLDYHAQQMARSRSGRAWERGKANLRATLGGAAQYLGAQTGDESVQEWGEDYTADALLDASLNPRDVESFQEGLDEGFAELGAWAQETMIENVPQLATMAGGAVAGGGVGGALGLAGRAAVGRTLASNLFRQSARRKLMSEATEWGARAGTAGSVYPQHLGEYALELDEAGTDLSEADDVWLRAGINSVLDTGGAETILRYGFKGLPTQHARDLVRRTADEAQSKGALSELARRTGKTLGEVGKAVGTGAAIEAPIEAAHELMYMTARDYHDPDFELDFDDPEVRERLVEGAAAGGLVGGAFGGAARGVGAAIEQMQPGQAEAVAEQSRVDSRTGGRSAQSEQPVEEAPQSTEGQSASGGSADGRVEDAAVDFGGEPEQQQQQDLADGQVEDAAVDFGGESEQRQQQDLADGQVEDAAVDFGGQQESADESPVDRAIRRTEAEAPEVEVPEADSVGRAIRRTEEAEDTDPDARQEREAIQAVEQEEEQRIAQEDADAEAVRSHPRPSEVTGEEPATSEVASRSDLQQPAREQEASDGQASQEALIDLEGADSAERPEAVRRALQPDDRRSSQQKFEQADYRDVKHVVDWANEHLSEDRQISRKGVGAKDSQVRRRKWQEIREAVQAATDDRARDIEEGRDVGVEELADGYQVSRTPERAESFRVPIRGQKDRARSNVDHVLSRLNDRVFGGQLSYKVSSDDAGVRIDYDSERPFPDESQRTDAQVGPGAVRSLAQAAARGEVHQQDRVQFRAPKPTSDRKSVFNLDTSRLTQLGASLQDRSWMDLNNREALEAYHRGAAFAADVLNAQPASPSGGVRLRPGDAERDRPPVHYAQAQQSERYRQSQRAESGPDIRSEEEAISAADQLAERYVEAPNATVTSAIERGLVNERHREFYQDPPEGEEALRADTFREEVLAALMPESEAERRPVAEAGALQVQGRDAPPAPDDSATPDPEAGSVPEPEAAQLERSTAPVRTEQQARRQARDAAPPGQAGDRGATRRLIEEQQRQGFVSPRPEPRPHPVQQLPFAPETTATPFAGQLNRYAEVGNALLREVGIDLSDSGPAAMTDGSNLDRIRQQAVEEAQYRADADANRAILDQLEQDIDSVYREPIARTMFLRYDGNRTRPVIYFSPKLLGRMRRGDADRALLHELGHVVMRDVWRKTDAETHQALQQLLGPIDDFARFEENFAEAFVRWSEGFVDELPGADRAQQRIRDLVRQIFSELHRKLRRLWNRARQRTETDVAFSTFMESLVNRAREQRGEARRGLTTQGISNPRIKSWIRQLDSRRLAKGQGFIGHNPALSESIDYGPAWPSREKSDSYMRRVYDRAQQLWDRHGKPGNDGIASMLAALWRHTGQPLDHETRAIRDHKTGAKGKFEWLADYFRRPAGERKQRGKGMTIPHEIRMVMEQYTDRLMEITGSYQRRLNWRDFTPFVRVREQHPVMKAVDEWHLDGTSIRDRADLTEEQRQQALQLHQDLQQLFSEIREWAIEQGVPIGRVDDYWPFNADPEQTQQLGREHLVERVQAWARDHMGEARQFIDDDLAYHESRRLRRLRMAQDDQEALRAYERQEQELEASRQAGHRPLADQLSDEQVLERMQRFAHGLYDAFTQNEGVVDPAAAAFREEGMGDFQSPGFDYGKTRRMPNSLYDYLSEFRERGVNRTMMFYIQSTVNRAVWTKHFALHDEIAEIDRRYSEAKKNSDPRKQAQALEEARQYKESREFYYEMYYGISLYDPSAWLKKHLRDEYDAGRIAPDDYKRLTDKIIPSYMGIWGNQSTGIAWRRLQQAIMMYQAFRILSLGIFAQFVDVGFITARAPSGYRRHVAPVLRELLSREGREEAGRVARAMGIAQRDALQHLHTDHMSAGLMTEKLERLHQGFFRANLMHYATNAARTFSLSLGVRLFQTYYQDFQAGKVDRSFFDELNVTPEEVGAWLKEWQDRDRPLSSMVQNGMYQHERVISALQQFVDETVVYPNPALRGAIGNHAATKVFWFLKSFVWAFHLQVLGRAFNQARATWGEREGLSKLASAMPMLSLAALTMPIGMASMELRWLISDPAHRPGFGSPAYAFEAAQRSGLPGMFQLYIDADVAEDYGRIGWLSAVGGPAVAHAEELVTEGVTNPSVLERSIPAYPILRFLRDDVFGQ